VEGGLNGDTFVELMKKSCVLLTQKSVYIKHET
jgi:hypothetical protein